MEIWAESHSSQPEMHEEQAEEVEEIPRKQVTDFVLFVESFYLYFTIIYHIQM